MNFASLFAGIGGFDIGFEQSGMECVLQCEIDEQAREVLQRHWPEVPKHDDITTLRGEDIAGVELICGGFPCQDLSVAGKRAGLAGARSGLWFEMLRVIDEARPEWVVWENVPGLLSADGGGAMGAVLESLAEVGYFGAWRVLDSQYFGVAQRRRRVFGVFAQGSAGCDRACAVLLEQEGGGWHPTKGGRAEEGAAACAGKCAGGDGKGRPLYYSHDYNQDRIYPTDGPSPACAARDSGGSRNVFIPETAYCLREDPGGIWQGHNTTFVSGPIDGWGGGACPERTQQMVVSPPDDAPGARETPGLPVGMDSRRYRQLGNAVTTNVVYWIGLRIMAIETEAMPL